MQLPSQSSVLAATRNIASAVAMAIGLFGLAGKIDLNQVTAVIKAGGDFVASLITFIGLAAPLVMAGIAAWKASHTQQVKAVAVSPGTVVVTDKATADAIPGNSVVSNTEAKVVPK